MSQVKSPNIVAVAHPAIYQFLDRVAIQRAAQRVAGQKAAAVARSAEAKLRDFCIVCVPTTFAKRHSDLQKTCSCIKHYASLSVS